VVEQAPRLGVLTLKTIVVHTVTYFLCGVAAFTLLDYERHMALPEVRSYMRQANDRLVMAGPLLQPIRGVLFVVAFYPLRDVLFGRRYGWLAMWLMLVMVGVLSTFGPSPGSIEGLIYTAFPVQLQLFGLPEVLLQTFLLSVLLCYWVNQPANRWFGVSMWVVFCLIITMSVLGLLVTPPA
jgi:hypothetical protein